MQKNRTTFTAQPEILLALRPGAGAFHLQIERGLRDAVRSGRLRRGAALPSTRELARDLGVSRGVVVEAYDQLIAEGVLTGRRGSGTYVAAAAPRVPKEAAPVTQAAARYDFRPGHPDLRLFPRVAFGRAARAALRSLGPSQLAYGDPQGAPELREALAEYAGRVRHVVADPRDIIVCNGFAQALGVLSHVLRRRGARRIGIEDPGHPGLGEIVRQAGLEPVRVAVDERGLRVD
ncbi:MAG TPA: PLP-dependent aminotransferase family protein, partial [Candidatus Eisenbacteria bacterium]|nr:PLP-dependent aminotransferase family protein [Candidatus Eisenbacteria bacterium]